MRNSVVLNLKNNIFTKAAVLLLLPLFFCSCSDQAKETVPDLSGRLSYHATVKYEGNEMNLDLERASIGVYSLTVVSPEPIKGMNFEYNAGTLTIKYLGLTKTFDQGAFPESSVIETLITVLDGASAAGALEYSGTRDGLSVYSGMSDAGQFELYFDTSKNQIEKLTLGNTEFEAIFTSIS